MKKDLLITPRFKVVLTSTDSGARQYYIEKPSAVGIIVLKGGKIGLLEIERYNFDIPSFEIVGGRIEDSETPLEAARRELKEEIGVDGVDLIFLTSFYPLPSVTNEKLHIFYADIGAKKTVINNMEGIRALHFLDVEQIKSLILDNHIWNGGDAYALLYFIIRRENR